MSGRLRIILLIGLALGALGFLSACDKTAVPDSSPMLRLIDGLPDSGVRKSPYLGRTASELGEDAYPVWSARLEDSGAAENALGLKRKIKLGTSELNILFAPPASEYAVRTKVPVGAVLDFGIGIVRDEYSEARLKGRPASGGDDGTSFFVSLEVEGRRRTIFQKYLTKPDVRPERTVQFVRERIELPPLDRDFHIILRTTGPEGTFAFWENPVLFIPSAARPNVVLISIDTLRADHLGCYGYGRETSPAMDALARDGALFSRTYSSSPWTLPSHVSMLTGLNTVHHRVYSRMDRIDPGLPTLADFLRRASYYCAATTGGAYLDPMFGFAKGFDEYMVRDGETDLHKLAEDRFRTISDWIETKADRSFFLFLHTYQVHSPYMSPEPFNSTFREAASGPGTFDVIKDLEEGRGLFRPVPAAMRENIIGLYDGEIRYTDEALVKALVDKLKGLGLYDRTLIILTSDHGEQFYDHGSWNHGNFLYDDALRVPLIVKFPGSRYRGARIEAPVRLIDLVPTILDEIGSKSAGEAFDGRSLLPLLEGHSEPARTILADVIDEDDAHEAGTVPRRFAVGEGSLKVIFDQGYPPGYLDTLTVRPPARPSVEAFDLARDPGETTDVSAANAETVRRLRAEVERIFREALPRRSSRTNLSPEAEAQLRALGYIR